MVLYGFKNQFAPLVANGSKVHTIRDYRKDDRHAKPGDRLQLYTGLRTKQCKKLLDPDPVCWDVFDINIKSISRLVVINGEQATVGEVAQLIQGGGFVLAFDFWDFFPTAEPRKLICWAEVQWLKRFQKGMISNGS